LRGIRTYYEILGVSPTASQQEMKTAYRRLLRQAHPDTGGSAALLDLVNEAYDTLKDPIQRARYDAAIRLGAKTTASGATEPRPPPPRTPPPRAGSSPPQSPPETPFARRTTYRRTARVTRPNNSGSTPPDDMPRSPSGRVPQWVIDEGQGLPSQHAVPWRASPSGQAKQSRRHERQRWAKGFASALTILAIVSAAAWLQASGLLQPGVTSAVASRPANWPTVGVGESNHPLGVPAPLVSTNASYRFKAHQADGTTPVAYDPCRPIHYVTRQQGQPAGGAEIITDAILRVSRATGLRFVNDGPTSEAPSREQSSYQPARYGDRWAPVLISWATAKEHPGFATDVAGEGGSARIGLPNRPSAYVTGSVELDSGQLTSVLQRPGGRQGVRAIVLHELGHLVGLDHIKAAGQLMYPKSQPGVTDFGGGDLTGLAALGRGTCVPEL
jgi:curved DNA-binding protein CbpA